VKGTGSVVGSNHFCETGFTGVSPTLCLGTELDQVPEMYPLWNNRKLIKSRHWRILKALLTYLLTYSLTHSLTPWSRVLLEKL